MKKSRLDVWNRFTAWSRFTAACSLLGSVCPGILAAEPTPTPVTEARELFNGQDLTNWYRYIKDEGKENDPAGVFTVRDGKLCISGEKLGCITTHEAFENYRLIVEYRYTGAAIPPRENRTRDCGILLHSVGKDGAWNGTWMYSIECNIIEGGAGDFIVVGDGSENYAVTANIKDEKSPKGCGIYDPNGKPYTINGGRIDWWGRDPRWEDVKGFRGVQDLEKPIGEWNTIEVICDGNTITNIVNGVVANRAYDVKPSCGKIQIQSEFAGFEFRRITILPLEKTPSGK